MLHDSVEQRFVGIIAPGNLFCQIFDGKIPNLFFEQVAAQGPAANEFVPGNRRFGPFLFRLPTREWMAVGGVSNSFVPKEQMLKQRRNGMCPRHGWRRSEFRRNLRQHLSERRPVPSALDRRGAIRIGDLLGFVQACLADTRYNCGVSGGFSLHQAAASR